MRCAGPAGCANGGGQIRKVNYAVIVNRIMPHSSHNPALECDIVPVMSTASAVLVIDILHIEAYLYLRTIEVADGEGKEAGSEERGVGARRRAQPQSRSRPRCLVRRQSVLRREGPGSGTLRA